MRIAMWSGPRNLSTAMMYSFGARDDCAVVDEPFYAAYLAATGLDHPMREEVLASQPTDPDDVVAALVETSNRSALSYEKHMTHHMLPGFPLDWMREVRNVFLIRHPARVIASYAAKRENPTLDDLGFRRQAEIYREAKSAGLEPIVIDSHDIRADPARMLARLCQAIEIGFTEDMLSWPQGGHPSDGVWAAHWYGAVHRSIGFAGPEGDLPEIPMIMHPLMEAAMPYYETLRAEVL
ncbi:HAD family hydrolase [Thalassococcus sp. S3]|uniref:sulfotransferase-like domain-containing protein n=1 Tax=Thalassococcus sp. S3 TaxID=2017482 RepID=UPI0010246695|nr:HAD family hydrolase [Thalassococcus sp. S3]QBF34130.1 sulfotransferase family protein [Thalassococcus sp. S3]